MGVSRFVVGSKDFFGVVIKQKGNIDINRLYKKVIPWFSGHGYFFTEKALKGRHVGGVQEERFEWSGKRDIDDYFRFFMEVEIIIYLRPKHISEITLLFKGYLETDYKNKFKGRFGAFLRKLYESYLIKEKIDSMEGKVWMEINDLIGEAKKVLGLVK